MMIVELALFVLLLALSALFSGSEAAFFSLRKSDLSDEKRYAPILKLLSQPRRLLITILMGNTVVNVFMASFAALVTASIATRLGASIPILLAVETVVLSVVILLVSEITPKILAIRNSRQFARRVSAPIRIVTFVLYPIAALLYNLTHLLTKVIPIRKEELFDTEEELKALAEVGADRGTLNPEEKEMIQSVFDFGETAVRKIMVPRIDIVGLEKRATLDEAIKMIRQSRFSKFPVYDENIDQIRGILYAKDVLPFLNGSELDGGILSICRDPYFIPEAKPIDDLLKDFQRRRETIGIVVDEYGGTAGLVTVEDVVEEVVGEIRDEFDRETPLIVRIDANRWLVDAKIPVNDLQNELPMPFPEEREYDTLGGFLYEQFGDIPTVGAKFDHSGYNLRVKSVLGNRIIQVVVTKKESVNE